jgi:DHA2 family multidrug resistance protein-like MFS transporter
VPAGVPPDAAEAARGTLGGAVDVAHRLPDSIGAALLHTAREAFTQAFEVAVAICAAIVVAMAIVTVVLLRRAGPAPA